jgi:hypothetical protein
MVTLVVAATTSPPTTKTRSSTRTTTALTTPISVVGDLCFNACFSQLEPKPPSGGQTKTVTHRTMKATGEKQSEAKKKQAGGNKRRNGVGQKLLT